MTDTQTDPALAVGLPTGLSSTAVAARKAALVAAGTPPIYAEKFAIDAENQQAWHDATAKQRGDQMPMPGTPAEREAAAIAAAQAAEKSKLIVPSEAKLEKRQDLVDKASAASSAVAGIPTTEEANK